MSLFGFFSQSFGKAGKAVKQAAVRQGARQARQGKSGVFPKAFSNAGNKARNKR